MALIKARWTAVQQLQEEAASDEDFLRAHQAHLVIFNQYLRHQSSFAADAPAGQTDMYLAPRWRSNRPATFMPPLRAAFYARWVQLTAILNTQTRSYLLLHSGANVNTFGNTQKLLYDKRRV